MAAEHFGVSRRYIHKVLASDGLTFTAFVLSKRLDQIRHELASASGLQTADLFTRLSLGLREPVYVQPGFQAPVRMLTEPLSSEPIAAATRRPNEEHNQDKHRQSGPDTTWTATRQPSMR